MRILVLMCFFCILTTNINSADWPHWRGPNQNGTSSEIDLIDQWEEGDDQQEECAVSDRVARGRPGGTYLIGICIRHLQ